jgi:hypothetical protein
VAGYWGLMTVILATWEAEIGRILVWGKSRQIVRDTTPISKITTAKKDYGHVLFAKHKALSSNPSPTKNKKNNKGTSEMLQIVYTLISLACKTIKP